MGAIPISIVWQVRRSDFFSVGVDELYKPVTIFGALLSAFRAFAIRFLPVTFTINFQHQHPTTAIYQIVVYSFSWYLVPGSTLSAFHAAPRKMIIVENSIHTIKPIAAANPP